MAIAQTIIDRHGGRVVESRGVVGVEGGGGGRRGTGVEIHAYRGLSGGGRGQIGGGNLDGGGGGCHDGPIAGGQIPGDLVAGGVHQIPVFIQLKLPVAGEGDVPVVVHAKKPLTIDGHIKGISRGLDIALSETLRNSGDLSPDSAGGAARTVEGRGNDIGKLRIGRFESDRAGIGDVVANRIQLAGGGIQPTESLLKSHDGCSLERVKLLDVGDGRKVETAQGAQIERRPLTSHGD